MDFTNAQQIAKNPKYQELVKVRSRYGWKLTGLMMLVYYGYIYMVAFQKDTLAQPLGEGVMTWSIPAGLGVIIFTVVITGVYVRRANTQFDRLTQEIQKEHN